MRNHLNQPGTIMYNTENYPYPESPCAGKGFDPEKQEWVPYPDPIENPEGYTQGKIEVWDYIVDQKMSFLEGNIIKYVSRYKVKNGLEDLKKAKQYLDKLIEEYENA